MHNVECNLTYPHIKPHAIHYPGMQSYSLYPDEVGGYTGTEYSSLPGPVTQTVVDKFTGRPHISAQPGVQEEPYFGSGISSHSTLSTGADHAGVKGRPNC